MANAPVKDEKHNIWTVNKTQIDKAIYNPESTTQKTNDSYKKKKPLRI